MADKPTPAVNTKPEVASTKPSVASTKPAVASTKPAVATGKPAATSKPQSAKPQFSPYNSSAKSSDIEATSLDEVVKGLVGVGKIIPGAEDIEPGSLRKSLTLLKWVGLPTSSVDKYTVPGRAITLTEDEKKNSKDAEKDAEKKQANPENQVSLFQTTVKNKAQFGKKADRFFSRFEKDSGAATFSLPHAAGYEFRANEDTVVARLGVVNPKKTAEQAAVSEKADAELVKVPKGAIVVLTNAEVLYTFQRIPGYFGAKGSDLLLGLDPTETVHAGEKVLAGINVSKSTSGKSSTASASNTPTQWVTPPAISLSIKMTSPEGKALYPKLLELIPAVVAKDEEGKQLELHPDLANDGAQGSVSNQERWGKALEVSTGTRTRSNKGTAAKGDKRASSPSPAKIKISASNLI